MRDVVPGGRASVVTVNGVWLPKNAASWIAAALLPPQCGHLAARARPHRAVWDGQADSVATIWNRVPEMALEAVWTQIDLGRALLDVDRGRATGVLRAAAATASALGATTLQQLAEKELRA